MMLIVFLLGVSLLVSAVEEVSQEECGFFCKVGKWWSEFRGEEVLSFHFERSSQNVMVGKAGEMGDA